MSDPEFENIGLHNRKVVLVLGLTGAGKTSFIQNLVPEHKRDETLIGSSMEPKTLDVTAHPVEIDGETVILVDTPGLGGEIDVFSEVGKWLARKDRIGSRTVHGIILFYSIKQNRIPTTMTTLNLRKELGKLLDASPDSSFPFFRVTVATTNWVSEFSEDGTSESEYTDDINADQIATETMLLGTWALLAKQGMTIQRYPYNAQKCAEATILALMNAEPPDSKIISARDRLIIAVIGAAQAGKSSFIGHLTGDNSAIDETRPVYGISEHEITQSGENIILLDTPGLDARPDREAVFKLILNWLKKQAKLIRQPRLYLDGIVVVHPPLIEGKPTEMISQTFLFNQVNVLLGGLRGIRDKKDEYAYRRLVLATSMWDKEDDTAMAEKEGTIKGQNWNIMLAAGSHMVRFDNTPKSARRIVELIVEEKKSRDPLYQYHTMMKEISDIKTEVEKVRRAIVAVREEQALLRESQDTLSQIPDLDKLIAAATVVKN